MGIPLFAKDLLQSDIPEDGENGTIQGVAVIRDGDILRAEGLVSESQKQTGETFGYKWSRRETFEGAVSENMRRWLIERYGDVGKAEWMDEYGREPVMLDAGCGGGMSGYELWAAALNRLHYVGVDISRAVEVARDRFREKGIEGLFIQSDLQHIPLPPESVDIVFSEGVLHHTDDTRAALVSVCRYLKPGGRILFYVYKKKGPIREFTDDYIRDLLQKMSAEAAWESLMPLTKLGKILGELHLEIEIPEEIDLLEIPAGKIDLQRLFYWHIFKAYYRPEMSLDEMNHINFDWYAPKNAHRQTPEQVRQWCREIGLEIERERVEEAGITIIAKKSFANKNS